MEYYFGTNGKRLLKDTVNAALDSGEWRDDFDIAVTESELDNDQAKRLMSALLKPKDKWQPLELSYLDGKLLRGHEIE